MTQNDIMHQKVINELHTTSTRLVGLVGKVGLEIQGFIIEQALRHLLFQVIQQQIRQSNEGIQLYFVH